MYSDCFIIWEIFNLLFSGSTFTELLLRAKHYLTPPPAQSHILDRPTQVWKAESRDIRVCEPDELAIDRWNVNHCNYPHCVHFHLGILDEHCQNLVKSPIKSVGFCWTKSNSFRRLHFYCLFFRATESYFFPISTLIGVPHLKFYVLQLSLFLSLFPVFLKVNCCILFLLNPIFVYLMYIKPGD